MDDIKEKINKIRFSFSGLSSFENCKKAWSLTYLDGKERKGNFFSDYGSFCHLILEKYFREELEIFELSDYYAKFYDENVVHPAPPFIKTDAYYKQGWEFFENLEFNRDDYEVLIIEDKIDVDLSEYNLVVKPDLVLKHKETGKIILLDYKTSIISKDGKSTKKDKAKLETYRMQMILYAIHLKSKGIQVNEVVLWFIRQKENKEYSFIIAENDEVKVNNWVENTIKSIKIEEEFPAKIDKFFCENLCGVRDACVPFIKFKEQNV